MLESCVQTEDVTDLKSGAVVHHEVAADNNVWGEQETIVIGATASWQKTSTSSGSSSSARVAG